MTRLTPLSSSEVISRVAHDLRATLNALAGWGGVLEAGPLSPEDVKRAGAAVSRQSHLTSRRLDLALDLWRLDVGLIEMAPAAVSASSMARAAATTCAAIAAQRGVTCEVTADETLVIGVHGQRFAQAVALLLEEVIGLAPANGRVRVDVSKQGDDVRVEMLPVVASAPRGGTAPFTRSLAVALLERQGGRVDAGDTGGFAISLPCAPASPSTGPA